MGLINHKVNDILDKYGLGFNRISKIDIRETFHQSRPNSLLPCLRIEKGMLESPHFELAELIINKGRKYALKNYKKTRYSCFKQAVGKNQFPKKMFKLIDSLKKGYLEPPYENDYIIVLNQSFAKTRYEREECSEYAPEIWSGHHRVGILLALGQFKVNVVIAEDIEKGSKRCSGKVHELCVKK